MLHVKNSRENRNYNITFVAMRKKKREAAEILFLKIIRRDRGILSELPRERAHLVFPDVSPVQR